MTNSVTVAIISDTHAHLDDRIADLIRNCDYAIHAGDICGESVLSEMHPRSGKVVAVAGNNDYHCHEAKDLPHTMSLDMPGGKIKIEHGHMHGHHSPSHSSLRKHHPDARVVVYGHTHKMVVDKSLTPWVVNPGAAGQTRTHGGPSCLVLLCDADQEWTVSEYRFEES